MRHARDDGCRVPRVDVVVEGGLVAEQADMTSSGSPPTSPPRRRPRRCTARRTTTALHRGLECAMKRLERRRRPSRARKTIATSARAGRPAAARERARAAGGVAGPRARRPPSRRDGDAAGARASYERLARPYVKIVELSRAPVARARRVGGGDAKDVTLCAVARRRPQRAPTAEYLSQSVRPRVRDAARRPRRR